MKPIEIAVAWETITVDEEAMKAAWASIATAGPWEGTLAFGPPTLRELLAFAEHVLRALGLYEWQVTVGLPPPTLQAAVYGWACLGSCDYTTREITILSPAEHPVGYSAKGTMLHEAAHATGARNDGHGKAFQRRHIELIKRFMGGGEKKRDG